MYRQLPNVLRRFDAKPGSRVPEPVVTQVIWASLAYLPSMAAALGLPEGLGWWQGGHGKGDLTGRKAWADPIQVHVEIKSMSAKFNVGGRCPYQCGQQLSQLEHMAHDANAMTMIITHSCRLKTIAEHLNPKVKLKSYSDVAGAIERALRTDTKPRHNLLESLFDVEPKP